MSVYSHLKEPKNTAPGLSDSIFIALVSSFATNGIKGTSTSPATEAAKTTITEDHTFISGHGFTEYICAPFQNQMTAATSGEPGSLGFEPTVTIFIPGSYAELHSRIMELKNKPLIVLAKDASCGSGLTYQMGNACTFAWITEASFGSGPARGGGQKGYNVTLSTASNAIYNYTGAITLVPSTPEEDEEEG